MYLLWHDDNTKKPQAQKIAEAISAYREKFKKEPSEVLVNEAELVSVPGVEVKTAGYVRKFNIWVGVA